MTVETLIKASLRKLGVYASGESPTAEELQDGLEALQSMLRSWSGRMSNVFVSTKESFTLVSGTASYSWGSGGDFSSARPNKVLGAYILDSSSVSHPVDVTLTEGEYRRISVKGTSSRPYTLYFHPSYPTATVYLYPTPNAAETLYVDSMKPFTESSSFDALASTLAFPVVYEETLIYSLGMRLAPEYEKTVSAEFVAIANSAYDIMMIANAAAQIEPVYVMILAGNGYGARYSINSDTYR